VSDPVTLRVRHKLTKVLDSGDIQLEYYRTVDGEIDWQSSVILFTVEGGKTQDEIVALERARVILLKPEKSRDD
jgi:hypothetical protein